MTAPAHPDVTIAIACYNQAHFLAEAIQSALSQSLRPEAVIVVDDGSVDNTAEVAGAWAGVRYHHQANAGLSAARNTGLALARTRLVLFLDADDRLTPDALRNAVGRFEDCPDAAFVYGGYREITEDGQPIGDHAPHVPADAFRALLRNNFIGMHGTVLYDTERLRAIGGFDTHLTACEDWDVYLRLARRHPIAAYPAIGAEYRRHGAGMSLDVRRMAAMTELVMARQRELGLDAEGSRAALSGIAFARRWRSQRLIGVMRSTPRRALGIAWTGWRNDALFPLRLVAAALRSLRR
ncbi:glycosyltransferase [Novosphingobium sp. MD-1]|uniref:glycosyltransferase n=1 Tax=Novosphingobium sp. MD-1 TaxID=1630648 RepID=UPI00061CD15C|nr:glycosyltransferase [Novosphingobium sp. MD-1]GAO55318.1 glycosyl transferase, family 2 [Novosphingobium sp. MD-1]